MSMLLSCSCQTAPFLSLWNSFCMRKPLSALESEVRLLSSNSSWQTHTNKVVSLQPKCPAHVCSCYSWCVQRTSEQLGLLQCPWSWRDLVADLVSPLACADYAELIKKTLVTQKFMQYLTQLSHSLWSLTDPALLALARRGEQTHAWMAEREIKPSELQNPAQIPHWLCAGKTRLGWKQCPTVRGEQGSLPQPKLMHGPWLAVLSPPPELAVGKAKVFGD